MSRNDFYGSIADAAARQALHDAVAEVKAIEGRVGADTIKLGTLIVKIQAAVETANGPRCWSAFARQELGLSPNTCSRLMKVARVFANLDCAERFQRSALYELAADYVSQEIRDEAIDLARVGEFVTFPIVAEMLSNHGVVRTPKKLATVDGLGMRELHVVRSALKRAFDHCPASDRRQLALSLQKLVNELFGETDDVAGDALSESRRLRTREAVASSANVQHQAAKIPAVVCPAPRASVASFGDAALACGVMACV